MKRVVLDTNVVISSASGGALASILDQWEEGAFTVIMSGEILEEYLEVISRPKFRVKQATLDRLTCYLYEFAEFVEPEENRHWVEADPQDDKFLAAALAGKADAIVSGDHHLLELKTFRAIPILTAREFIETFRRR